MNHKRVLHTISATKEVPRHTRLHSRGTPRFPSQLKKSLVFLSSSQDECPLPCFIGKGIPVFLSHLKRRRSPLESREELQGSCHHSKRPRCPNPLQIHLIPLHCGTVTHSINTKYDGSCDSPVAPQEKAIDPYINSTGSLPLLLQLKRKADLHVSTQEEA